MSSVEEARPASPEVSGHDRPRLPRARLVRLERPPPARAPPARAADEAARGAGPDRCAPRPRDRLGHRRGLRSGPRGPRRARGVDGAGAARQARAPELVPRPNAGHFAVPASRGRAHRGAAPARRSRRPDRTPPPWRAGEGAVLLRRRQSRDRRRPDERAPKRRRRRTPGRASGPRHRNRTATGTAKPLRAPPRTSGSGVCRCHAACTPAPSIGAGSDRSDGGVLVGDAFPALGWRLPKWLRRTPITAEHRHHGARGSAVAPSAARAGPGWPPPTSTPPSLRSDTVSVREPACTRRQLRASVPVTVRGRAHGARRARHRTGTLSRGAGAPGRAPASTFLDPFDRTVPVATLAAAQEDGGHARGPTGASLAARRPRAPERRYEIAQRVTLRAREESGAAEREPAELPPVHHSAFLRTIKARRRAPPVECRPSLLPNHRKELPCPSSEVSPSPPSPPCRCPRSPRAATTRSAAPAATRSTPPRATSSSR